MKSIPQSMMKNDELARDFERRCLALLAQREYSRAELAAKAADIAPEIVSAVLDKLAADGWQSDQRFCAVWVRSKAEGGDGAQKIRQALKQRGIADALIAEQCAQFDWFALAERLYRKKYTKPAHDLKEQAKRQRFLAQRGFSFAEIRHAQSVFESEHHDAHAEHR